ncbi:immunoglobulin-like domain-containing protein [Sporosarcina jiandibaonis]|uniref:immunoglobulin-like domain-containing protein n=1 Tax=Sporosarcina jiandibaonis TaxID=2715535 RepID=UPI001556A2EC|nr:immunoglobulin-like domain-containing protein [Sporosarcina jiandibaonis]
MKRILISIMLILSTCGNETVVNTLPDPVPDQEIHSSEEGLSLTLLEDTFTGSPSIISTYIQNESQDNYSYGGFYHIEVEKDGQWFIITYSDAVFIQNPRFKDFGSTLLAGDEAFQSFSVEELGVTLFPGDYRLVKTFLSQGESFYEITVAVPFFVK